jgi:hypothetical protein
MPETSLFSNPSLYYQPQNLLCVDSRDRRIWPHVDTRSPGAELAGYESFLFVMRQARLFPG